MRLPFSFWKSAGGPSIADLSPDFYFKAPYAGVPFLPTAPGNTHGNLTKLNALAADVGPLINGHACARMPGPASRAFKAATAVTTDIILANSFTILAFSRALSLGVDDANFRNEPQLASDDNAQFGLARSASGYRAGIFDPAFGPRQTTYIPTSFGLTAIAAGSDGALLPQAQIFVASTAGANATGRFTIAPGTGLVEIAYTGIAGNSFTGCTGGAGQALNAGHVVTASVWAMSVMRYDAVFVKCLVSQPSGTAEVQAASVTSPFIVGGVPRFGESVTSGAGIVGDYLEIATWKRVLSAIEIGQARAYLNRVYQQGLT